MKKKKYKETLHIHMRFLVTSNTLTQQHFYHIIIKNNKTKQKHKFNKKLKNGNKTLDVVNLDEIMFTRTILKLNKNSLKIPLPRKKMKTTKEITHIHTKNTFIHFIHKNNKKIKSR